ncbi:MAG: hypothetical protein GXP26_11570, partial [Planctomycetes bacterium]|nr:hypothetical protein [Planctomycetota bacterium]
QAEAAVESEKTAASARSYYRISDFAIVRPEVGAILKNPRCAAILLGMAILIGIDEAGYGPNLGPLVVGATAWWEEEGSEVGGQRSGEVTPPVDLYARLAEIVTTAPSTNQIAIADSKTLYKPGGGLRQLERGVLTARTAIGGDSEAHWQKLFDEADPEGHRHELPWYADYNLPLPIDASADEIAGLQTCFCSGCEDASVGLIDVRARVVFPREFNELTDHYGTKGATLSHISIALLKEVLENPIPDPHSPAPPTHITFDKHGGRNRYAALLQHHFPGERIETLLESRAASHYQWGPAESRITATFRTRGEEELPTALASMVAKYHRELAMRAFNAYWSEKVADLRPTAGYPMDAKRFKDDIASMQRKLCIDDRQLWRNR